ncbi:MAG: hypothetical protein H6696_07670 [Deferribacteres bacterium]|nr:hypothetical protein [Deferribacteres bacterium]
MKVGIENVISELTEQEKHYFPAGLEGELKVVRKIWRPYSRVYRIQAGANGSTRYFWVKMFKMPEGFKEKADKYLSRLKTEFDITQKLQAAFVDTAEMGVISPLAFFPQFGAVVTWESKGQPLSDLIDRNARLWSKDANDSLLLDYAHKCGQALARMQQFTLHDTEYDPFELIEYADIRLQRLVKNKRAPFSEAQRKQVLTFLEREIPHVSIEERRVCGVHSDFAAFNVLAADGHITLTDFTSFKTGSSYVDLTYFYQRLGGFLHKPIFRENFIRQLQQEFLSGYGISGIEHHRMFTLSLVRHTINNFSSLARNRRGGLGKIPLPHVQLFHRRIFHIYREWLDQVCV